MLLSHALPFRPVVLLQVDVWNVPQTFTSESCLRKETDYCGLSSPLFLRTGKKAHVKLAWTWSSSICLPNMRIEDINVRRRIVAAVALTPGKTVDFGMTRDEKKALDYAWIGAGAPSSIAGNGSLAGSSVLPTQQGEVSNSSHNNGTLFVSEEKRSLHSTEDDTFAILRKEEAPPNSGEQLSVVMISERDVAMFETEYSRRKKISEANRGKSPWNKGKKFPQGVPQSVRTAVPMETSRDLGASSNLLMLEKQRRQRISMANKGKVPWNKGRKHSEETIQRIRTRTAEAMKDPKIREKLRIHGEMQSPETRSKISKALLKLWSARRELFENQQSCLKEWKEMIAEEARRGDDWDETYEWESWTTTVQKLRDIWELSVEEERKKRRRAAAQARRTRTPDHRRKIAEAIRAKWNDPNFRLSVQRGIHAHLLKRGIEPGKGRPRRPYKKANTSTIPWEKKPDILVSDVLSATSEEISATAEPIVSDVLSATSEEISATAEPIVAKALPAYKNPSTPERLEKLRQIRASRLSEETKRREVTERARILMAEAKRAARALEAAAVKDKNALAPLLETRRLLAEAARSFETAGLGKESSPDSWRGEGSDDRWRIDGISRKRFVDQLNLLHDISSTKTAFYCASTVIVNNFLKNSVWMIHYGMARVANRSLRRRCTMGNC